MPIIVHASPQFGVMQDYACGLGCQIRRDANLKTPLANPRVLPKQKTAQVSSARREPDNFRTRARNPPLSSRGGMREASKGSNDLKFPRLPSPRQLR
jgi:hypothetical protein